MSHFDEAGNGPVRFEIVSAGQVESALDEIPSDTALVICDEDGIRAVSASQTVISNRTAVFVGNLASGEDRRAVAEMSLELFPR